jgi:hypothetical protein
MKTISGIQAVEIDGKLYKDVANTVTIDSANKMEKYEDGTEGVGGHVIALGVKFIGKPVEIGAPSVSIALHGSSVVNFGDGFEVADSQRLDSVTQLIVFRKDA